MQNYSLQFHQIIVRSKLISTSFYMVTKGHVYFNLAIYNGGFFWVLDDQKLHDISTVHSPLVWKFCSLIRADFKFFCCISKISLILELTIICFQTSQAWFWSYFPKSLVCYCVDSCARKLSMNTCVCRSLRFLIFFLNIYQRFFEHDI